MEVSDRRRVVEAARKLAATMREYDSISVPDSNLPAYKREEAWKDVRERSSKLLGQVFDQAREIRSAVDAMDKSGV